MERAGAASVPEVMGRYLSVDGKGTGLRATWRPAQGFTNLSLWHGTVCVETFHMSPEQMGELIAFLGASLAAACPAQPALRLVQPSEASARRDAALNDALRTARHAAARLLDAVAARVRPPHRG